ncbi:uncharacterized protein LOC132903257 [Amyelois transitella]|uniref:uncharacterized protein LOC132903257 n=1 Tax=Amyelois transitella TaxID=680683 RepID=UPI00298F5D60|nr:uncharacterized protein LOC132903257 [Amyelois transitella]
MPKVPKVEEGELSLNIPDLTASDTEEKSKSAPGSPRITRRTTAALAMSTLELNVLFKFIKSYDGSRETLNSFLVNCDNALNLATEIQKPILFKFILSQLNGKAEVACSIKEFLSWEQLKEFLKTQFSERKHYSHLLTDLQENKQGPQETVNVYALRTETYLSQLLTEISLSTSKPKELPGRTAAMEDLALHHFVMGLHPRISNIVRCKSPKTLNEAINFAISEERIQQTIYKRSQPDTKSNSNNQQSNKFKPNNSQKQSYYSNQPQPRTSNTMTQGTSSSLFCRYCKLFGHDLLNCKKREFNNNRYKVNQNPHSNHGSFRPPPRVNFLEQPDEEEGHDEVDLQPNNDLND